MGKKVYLNKYIIKEGTLEEMGAKGYNLNVLKRQDIKVPDFFCYNSRAFEEAMDFRKKAILEKFENIDYEDEESIQDASNAAINILRAIRCWEFEDIINVFLREKFKEEDLFSIRTSNNYEDLSLPAEERIFKIYQNVERKEVFDYIRQCWYETYSPKSLKYYHEHDIDIKNVRMGVLIQKMQGDEIAGVAYTVNPKGLLNEVLVIVGNGTSEDVVTRKVNSTSYHYSKDDRVVFYEIRNNSMTLTVEQLRKVVEEVLKIEKSFGKYTQIYWSLCNGELFIQQAQKIPEINEKEKIMILDNKDVVDKYPGVMLPLTESFVKISYGNTLKKLAKRTFPRQEILQKYEDVFEQMIYDINGRIYTDLASWNLYLQFIPLGNSYLPKWQKQNQFLNAKNKPIKGYEIVLKNAQINEIKKNSSKLFKNNNAAMKELIEDFEAKYESFRRRYSKNMNNQDLCELYNECVDSFLEEWDLTYINEIYTHRYMDLLRERLEKVKVENKNDFIIEYISDIYNNETELFIRELLSIAVMVEDSLLERLVSIETTEEAEAFLLEDTDFSQRLRTYLKVYGDIVLDSVKLESITFRDNPKLLIEKIIEYAKDKENTRKILANLMDYVNQNVKQIIKKQTGLFNRHGILELEKICRELVGYGQSVKVIKSKLYEIVRRIFWDIAQNLYHDGVITSKQDIYYLYIDEIIRFIKGEEVPLKELALQRRQYFYCYFRLPSYTKLIFSGKPYNRYHVNVNYFHYDERKQEFEGTPFSKGEVEKEVVVVYTKEDLKDIKDKIIVAETTDSGWFLDIVRSAGLITEYGSCFSSTAVLARDIQIPYVSGIKNVTAFLKTGDKIRLDGNTGKVTILPRKEE